MKRTVAWLLIFVACFGRRQGQEVAQRTQELANCQVIGGPANLAPSGNVITRCLVLRYNWNARDAVLAGHRYQARLDSLPQQIAAATRWAEAQLVQMRAQCVAAESAWRHSAVHKIDSSLGDIAMDSSLAAWDRAQGLRCR
jgi:hypothetical protein